MCHACVCDSHTHELNLKPHSFFIFIIVEYITKAEGFLSCSGFSSDQRERKMENVFVMYASLSW